MTGNAVVPFFEAPGGDRHADRLLLISDQFPPGQSAGALRWQKLARFAAERGWELDVITRDPAHLSARDESRLDELPPGTRAYAFSPHDLMLDRVETRLASAYRSLRGSRVSSAPASASGVAQVQSSGDGSVAPQDVRWQPASRRFWLRSYWAVLDHRRQLAWARDVEAMGRRVLDRRHRAVISCGPWHLCNHEALPRSGHWCHGTGKAGRVGKGGESGHPLGSLGPPDPGCWVPLPALPDRSRRERIRDLRPPGTSTNDR
jgi:hypothetical protein